MNSIELSEISFLEITADLLAPETLRALIEAFVLREGTDYGAQEIAHETKIQQVARQLHAGQVKILFEPATETTTLVTAEELRRRMRQSQARS